MRVSLLISLGVLILVLNICSGATKVTPFELKDLQGNVVKLQDYIGKKVVLLSFWATYCKPCKKEMPKLQEIYNDYKENGFEILSIATDPSSATSAVRLYIKQYGYTFPILLDVDSKVIDMFHPDRTLPYSVLIDKEGNIAATHSGYKPGDEVHLREEIKSLLQPQKMQQ